MKPRIIAYYLPQFHPIPENDAVWGKGFTEWTNVAKAKPLFKGHYQPRIPADLGFYDLRPPEVREHQTKLGYQLPMSFFLTYNFWRKQIIIPNCLTKHIKNYSMNIYENQNTYN